MPHFRVYSSTKSRKREKILASKDYLALIPSAYHKKLINDHNLSHFNSLDSTEQHLKNQCCQSKRQMTQQLRRQKRFVYKTKLSFVQRAQ